MFGGPDLLWFKNLLVSREYDSNQTYATWKKLNEKNKDI